MGIRKIELLAPAKDLGCGLAAIQHGADAVYIGGPQFGARAAAANSLQDLEKLVTAAHQFRVKVYVAMNTVFDDRELDQAVNLAWQLYGIGIDALIIQDMGLLECDLPPIPLHASTQVNNRTPPKVAFLEKVGFQQVVLARELSLAEIREIRATTSVSLEFFVHGALCVSYSGQCYISEVMAGRSANRGECAQFCRHRYTLRDDHGTVLARDRYLLSLKDLDLSASLSDLIAAGIDSFKIEGRLKDQNYVKNVTAYYRRALDEIIDRDEGLTRASSGSCSFSFVPDPARSFSRGHTDYFLQKKRNRPGAIDSPKSLGMELGRVIVAERQYFTLATGETVGNGDGLCFFDLAGNLTGMKVNRVAAGRIYPKDAVIPPPGTTVYRNADTAFARLLAASELCRTLALQLDLREAVDGLLLHIIDEDGVTSETRLKVEKETARQPGSAALQAARQLKKSGGTIFAVEGVTADLGAEAFFPAAAYNELRRRALAHHEGVRLSSYPRQHVELQVSDVPWPETEVSYLDNIANRKAEDFYRRHGVREIDSATLRAEMVAGCALMTTRYCIKAQLGICPKEKKRSGGEPVMPLTLSDNTGDYNLEFDCRRCGMIVRKSIKRI
ncbi:MAG TPA: collagenase-like protease [Desulfobulbaceae bacterium]|nr:collagenase-like protease [Desulfobulbaceae bacterium]